MKRILLAFSMLASSFCYSDTFSNAVVVGDYAYVSAQLPIDPTTGTIVSADIGTLTNIVLDHVQHALHVKGFKMNQVIKTEVYLTDIRNFTTMDSAYAQRFPYKFPPARDVMEVSNLPDNSPIQISCIAYINRISD